jgi:hypothetical protein
MIVTKRLSLTKHKDFNGGLSLEIDMLSQINFSETARPQQAHTVMQITKNLFSNTRFLASF